MTGSTDSGRRLPAVPPTPIAIVGLSAVMPEAPNAATFWDNIKGGKYCITGTPPERWDPALYYDADPKAPGKTYSAIGGWVREFEWDPFAWKLPIPPRVGEQFDEGQKWSVSLARTALMDFGWPEKPMDTERCAVIIGNAIGGEKHYATNMRIQFPEFERELRQAPSFATLPEAVRESIVAEAHKSFDMLTPDITEDTMPGELANIIAGRVANLFNLRGPNFTTDAACASGLAALSAAANGLAVGDFDTAIAGGIDRNMGIAAFVKFCKIGALSATGTRPFDAGADGFVMGEGGALFILKRLADAERDGDHIYAVIIGIGGSSDGKGKGITAPNPIGQKLAVERAWSRAGVDPATIGLIEAHGTSTRVGDVGESQALTEVLLAAGARQGSVALGSVKSNIGHLKAAAGVAGLFKAAQALSEKVLPPSLNFKTPNPNIDWANSPLKVNTELREWAAPAQGVRTAGVSAFGFGGTNFHVALEEYLPGRHRDDERSRSFAGVEIPSTTVTSAAPATTPAGAAKAPLRGAVVVGAADDTALAARLEQVARDAESLAAAGPCAPLRSDLSAPVRVAIDYADAAELSDKATKAREALVSGQPVRWRPLRSRGVFLGRGPAPKTAFLFTGQGSQYVNMLRGLRDTEPVVADTFAEADAIMTPLLGRPLSTFIFGDDSDPAEQERLTQQLLQTEITQPAMLTADAALMALIGEYGMHPDMVMGHSLGEYAALVAAGSLTVPAALEAVSARGREMAGISVDDNGILAAVMAPLEEVQQIVDTADGYVVIANVNSNRQAVIGGATAAVEKVIERITAAGGTAIRLPVSHAFHTSIVAPASAPLREQLRRLTVKPPQIPIIANVNGEFYPSGPDSHDAIIELLGRQVAEPVQFVKGLETLYAAGARVFVEVGPKKALHGMAEDVLGGHDDVTVLFTNHPKFGDVVSLNQALCGMYAAGLGTARDDVKTVAVQAVSVPAPPVQAAAAVIHVEPQPVRPVAVQGASVSTDDRYRDIDTDRYRDIDTDRYRDIGRFIADIVDRGRQLFGAPAPSSNGHVAPAEPVVISGASLGLPGADHVFDDANVGRILSGQQFITAIPPRLRKRILDKNITRLVKSDDGSAGWLTLSSESEIIKLAGRAGALDAVTEFGIDPDRDAALDAVTRLAIGAGIDALRDAGIPLVLRYRTTSIGTELPDRWMLPDELRDDTGIVFASAFPGLGEFADELERYFVHAGRLHELESLVAVRARVGAGDAVAADLDSRIRELRATLEAEPYVFDRRFLFRVLSMGHSQFAEIIGARGPNTQVNAACASATQAIGVAQDWIRTGRCRRVLVVSADDISQDHLIEWMGSGFLATGAAATDERVEDAALPFDNRRHGMLIGMGAAAFVVEAADAVRERGIAPLVEVLATTTANSAFHGTRLDIDHIAQVMENLVASAEKQHGLRRGDIARQAMFMSHETYTPARGGSASAEVNALRRVFGADADSIVVTNTKGFTGHAMGAGIEDAVAIKALETGVVPPIPNFREVDPGLGALNLSRGGEYPLEFALRLAAGFGSQIAMSLVRHVPSPTGVRPKPDQLGFSYRVTDQTVWRNWLRRISGQDNPALEVVSRRLRVADPGLARRQPAAAPATAAPVAVDVSGPVATPVRPVSTPVAVQQTAQAPVAATPAAVPAPAPAGDDVLDQVLAIVAETTGYPAEMLDPDLDLEADLGVDTVKQAEVFAAVRAAFEIPRDDNLKLRDYPTLSAVVAFVRERAGVPLVAAPGPAAAAIPAQASPVEDAPLADTVLEQVLAIVAETTGYPAEMLDPDLDLEADLGVDTVKQAEVFAAVRAAFEIPRDDNLKLRDYPTLSAVVAFVRERTGIALAPAKVATPAAVAAVPVAAAAPVAVAPVAVRAVAAAPAAPQAPAATGDPVLERVLAIVAETTGYPPEMLDLELDLEADLGVDTVKQAEVFAAVRAAFDIPRDDNLKLRDYPTLAAVVGFVRNRAGLPAPAPVVAAAVIAAPSAPAEAATAPAGAAGDPVVAKVLSIVAETTGYPPEMLDLELDLEADLGIDTVKQAEVFAAVRAAFDIPRDENLKLRDYPTLSAVVGFIRERAGLPETPVAPVAAVASVAAVAAGAPAPAANTPAVAGDPVLDKVLSIVAETTGYPPEMLDLELDLEADLGIDTVKQAEVFAAVRGAFDIPRDENLKLRDYPTLSAVVGFVRERAQTTPAAEASAQLVETETDAHLAQQPAGFPAPPVGSIDAANAIARRVPVPVLRPSLAQCKPTGVVLDASARVVLAADLGGVGDALAKRLAKLGVTVLRLDPAADASAIAQALDGWLSDGAVTGVYWLPALDDEGPVDELDHAAWREALRVRVKNLYATMRRLSADAPFLVTGTRLGGKHGYDAAGATSPLGGAVTGFAKAYKREQPEALVKAVDFAASRRTARLADVLVDETLRDPGCVEVGSDDIGAKQAAGDGGRPSFRWGIGLRVQPAVDGSPGMDLNPGSVYVITGAAGSIVSAISADLARSGGGGVFHLLDLTPAPDPDDADLRQFLTDKEGLKSSLIARMKADGSKVTPVMVEKELARIERLAMAEAAIAAVTEAGGTARYHCVDLTDAEAVDQIMAGVAQAHGHVDVVLLAAGIEISRLLAQKEQREYDLVFGVKSDGWFNVLHGLGDTPVGATVAFSSVAGRFGNVGQTDYSAANDLLCKLTSNLRRTRPDVRGIVIDWTAWGGIGMATRGSIPTVMAAAGIDMLPAEAGIATIRRELVSGGTRGELVVAGRLGMMGAEFDETGGLDTESVDLSSAGPMLGRVTGMGVLSGLTAEVELDPKVQPFLNDHRIEGTAVLPGVMGVEGFAELAGLLLPGWSVVGVEHVEFLEPVKFYRDEPRTLMLSAVLHDADPASGELVADCSLHATRTLVTSPEPVVTEHFRAQVRLAPSPAAAEDGEPAPQATGVTTTEELYQVYFHGPAYQVLGRAWHTDGGVAGELSADLPDNHVPAGKALAAKPRLIELCFQTAGLLGLANDGVLGLPNGIERVVLPGYAAGDGEAAGLVAVASPRGEDLFDVRVVDNQGRTVLRLEGYRTVAFPAPVAAERLEPLRRAVGS